MKTASIDHVICCVVCIAVVLSTAWQLNGQTILVDDFNDGNDEGWTHYVLPEEDAPWGPGIFDATSGEYNLKTTSEVAVGTAGGVASVWDASAESFYTDGFVRATMRSESGGANAALWLRANPLDGGTYIFTTTIFGGLDVWDCTVTDCRYLGGRENVGFTRGEDWIMEAGAVGDMLSVKIWPAEGPEPDRPQLEIRDSANPTGQFGAWSFVGSNWQVPDYANAFFDDIYFTPVPEPSALILSALAFLGLLKAACRLSHSRR